MRLSKHQILLGFFFFGQLVAKAFVRQLFYVKIFNKCIIELEPMTFTFTFFDVAVVVARVGAT
jgi:hypothetical protein